MKLSQHIARRLVVALKKLGTRVEAWDASLRQQRFENGYNWAAKRLTWAPHPEQLVTLLREHLGAIASVSDLSPFEDGMKLALRNWELGNLKPAVPRLSMTVALARMSELADAEPPLTELQEQWLLSCGRTLTQQYGPNVSTWPLDNEIVRNFVERFHGSEVR